MNIFTLIKATKFAHFKKFHHGLLREESHPSTWIPDCDGRSWFGAAPMVYGTFYHLNLSQNNEGIGHIWLLNDAMVNCPITPVPLRMEPFVPKKL